MLSMTLTDLAGRNLSGQTVEAFWTSIAHTRPLCVGLNCSFGATELRPHVQALAAAADAPLMVYPNAGLPNEFGAYDEAPETTAGLIRGWAERGLVNVVGGCCGTTPAHIAAIARAVAGLAPRVPPRRRPGLLLAGLEAFAA
jgi:5-methyltetrahydrofolate--homocysteine methyltransferase